MRLASDYTADVRRKFLLNTGWALEPGHSTETANHYRSAAAEWATVLLALRATQEPQP